MANVPLRAIAGKSESYQAGTIDRNLRVPLYLQIKQELLRRIAAQSGDGQRFHSDEELCTEFGVSRMTVRQAVKELVDEGYLTRARGLGTFLTVNKVRDRPLSHHAAKASFGTLGTASDIQKFESVPCPPAAAAQLGISVGTLVKYLQRIRKAGVAGVPVSFDRRWMPLDCAEGLDEASLHQQTLVQFIGDRRPLDRAEMQFEGGLASAEVAHALGILPGDPVLVRHLVYRTQAGRPVLAGESTHRSDLSRYSVDIVLASGKTPTT